MSVFYVIHWLQAHRLIGFMALALGAVLLVGCASEMVALPANTQSFQAADKNARIQYASAQDLAELEAPVQPVYRLGAGDVVNLQVWSRPELSGRHTLGPDGVITVPMVGSVKLETLTREEASSTVAQKLGKFYVKPNVTLAVEQYVSNRVMVLGRVGNPGVQNFERAPTLLEVLAKAGSLPVIDKQATLARCAIFRGREKIIWVDLKRLLNGGEVQLNVRLQAGDLVYIPDSSDTMVYVLGSVVRPGAYRLTPDMSLMDALASAGGPNDDAKPHEIAIYRPSTQSVEKLSLQNLMDAKKPVNFSLQEGDVIYVPKSGLAEFGYFARQISPGLGFLTLGAVFK